MTIDGDLATDDVVGGEAGSSNQEEAVPDE
jgi:hypothetical protein